MNPFLTCLAILCLGGCAAIDLAAVERSASRALPPSDSTALARQYSSSLVQHPDHSAFQLVDNGLQALAMRLQLAERAEQTLDLQYYILRSDLSGLLLLDQLLQAADRGVRIRLLLDDLHFDQSALHLAALDTHPGVEVRVINPFVFRHTPVLGRLVDALYDFSRVQRRMHNKVFIADNTVAIVGGRNLGDEYFEAHPRIDLRDIDLWTLGPVVPRLSASFDAYWNFDKSVPVTALGIHPTGNTPLQDLRMQLDDHRRRPAVVAYLEELAATPPDVPVIWARGQVLADFPCKLSPGQPDCASLHFDRFHALFRETESELLIISPYFIPGKDGIALFRQLKQQGVEVRVLTNSYAATDLKIVQAGYNRYRRPLLEEQIALFEFKRTFPPPETRKDRLALTGSSQACMHAKAYVMDRRRVFIGSFNHDPRSAALNTEVGILVDSPELASRVAALFAHYTMPHNSYRLQLIPGKKGGKNLVWHTVDNGQARAYHQEPLTTWWQHLKNALLSVFAPEDLL